MSDRYKVTVIVRVYNRENTIRRALESIISQSYTDWDIVVVDDGSSDRTLSVIEELHCTKLRLIRHPKNLGVGAAANSGIKAARGGLLAFLDSDDEWKPDKLQVITAFMEKHPEAEMVFHDADIVANTKLLGSLFSKLRVFPTFLLRVSTEALMTNRQVYLCLLEETPIKPSAFVVRRELFERVGLFNEQCRSGEDWEFCLRAFREDGSCGVVNQPLVRQYWSADGTHRRFFRDDKEFILGVLQREKARLAQDSTALHALKRGISKQCSDLGFEYLQSGQTSTALKCYLQGLRNTRDPRLFWQLGACFLPNEWRQLLRRSIQGMRARNISKLKQQ